MFHYNTPILPFRSRTNRLCGSEITLALVAIACTLCAATPVYAQQPSSAFTRLDSNKDGRLTGIELKTVPSALLKQIDQNGDGVITASEDIRHQRNTIRPSHSDINYAGDDNPRHTLDIWGGRKPGQITAPVPVLLWIHGGAWRSGSKESLHTFVKQQVLTTKFIGVSINYRLSQEAKWPAQLHDCKAAIRWVAANIRKHGGDPEKIILLGSSAGGHLVSMLTTTNTSADSNGTIGRNLNASSRVLGGIDLYGPTDFLRMNDFPSNIDHDSIDSPESQLIGGPIQQNPYLVKRANPIQFVDKNDAPLLLIHGTVDPLVCFNQSELLYSALKKKGVPTSLITVNGAGHGGFMTPKIEDVMLSFVNYLIGASTKMPPDAVIPARVAK